MNSEKIKTIIIIILAILLVGGCGFFGYKYLHEESVNNNNQNNNTQDNNNQNNQSNDNQNNNSTNNDIKSNELVLFDLNKISKEISKKDFYNLNNLINNGYLKLIVEDLNSNVNEKDLCTVLEDCQNKNYKLANLSDGEFLIIDNNNLYYIYSKYNSDTMKIDYFVEKKQFETLIKGIYSSKVNPPTDAVYDNSYRFVVLDNDAIYYVHSENNKLNFSSDIDNYIKLEKVFLHADITNLDNDFEKLNLYFDYNNKTYLNNIELFNIKGDEIKTVALFSIDYNCETIEEFGKMCKDFKTFIVDKDGNMYLLDKNIQMPNINYYNNKKVSNIKIVFENETKEKITNIKVLYADGSDETFENNCNNSIIKTYYANNVTKKEFITC